MNEWIWAFDKRGTFDNLAWTVSFYPKSSEIMLAKSKFSSVVIEFLKLEMDSTPSKVYK